ncbi:MAG: hypothetical protein AB2794_03800 [Candidatus Thiodiazotropha endolucinida]
MTMKTCKHLLPPFLTALLTLSAPVMARDDLHNCYNPVMPYIDQSLVKTPERELFVLTDQTVRYEKKLAAELLRKTLGYIRQGDKITVVSFSANANTHYTELEFSGAMEHPLPDTALNNTPTKHIRAYKRCLTWQEKSGKKAIAKGIVKALTLPDDNYDFTNTEIIGAINTLANDLIGKSEIRERTLVLYSDGFENSRLTTFFKKGDIRLIKPKTEIVKVKKAKMIPDLSGVKVYVIGGGWLEDGSLYLDSRKLKALRDFWGAFFAASGASLEGFGQPMLLTELR